MKKPIHCPKCGKLLAKRDMNDEDIIEEYCPDCKENWVFKIEIKLKAYKEYKEIKD